MPYHTGKTSNRIIQYRGIEDWWGGLNTWIDGINTNSSDIYVVLNPGSFSDSETAGVNIGSKFLTGNNQYIHGWGIPQNIGYEGLLFPNSAAAGNTYICDGFNATSGTTIAWHGSTITTNDSEQGAFALRFGGSSSFAPGYVYSRLMKLPNNT